jgi:EAL domain-containing protein (putative c-di-GMP-specific phosphodiesterase class I)
MVQAMTEIAHTLGIEIIAEHALDAETIKCLSEIGAEYAQGFGIGNPIPFESVWDA